MEYTTKTHTKESAGKLDDKVQQNGGTVFHKEVPWITTSLGSWYQYPQIYQVAALNLYVLHILITEILYYVHSQNVSQWNSWISTIHILKITKNFLSPVILTP